MKVNQKAWDILGLDEKTALGLQHGLQKSSWESGEIMDKSHYKYLEIKYRAEKFLKMFTDHLVLFDHIIPEYVKGEGVVLRYLNLCIEKRMKPTEAMSLLNDNHDDKVYNKATLNSKIIIQFRKWEKSENAYEASVFNLIKEFDRWNNFRILPKEIQEPSAFKRRIKNTYKKHIKVLTSIPALSLKKLRELCETKKAPCLYLPLIHENQMFVIRVKNNRNCTGLLNELGLYTFNKPNKAQEYITNVFHYINKGKKDCKDGLDFWQKYRDQIKDAHNYNEIQKITPSRKYLELAFRKLEFV